MFMTVGMCTQAVDAFIKVFAEIFIYFSSINVNDFNKTVFYIYCVDIKIFH